MNPTKEIDVETDLRRAAADAAWPATPDIRARVAARIEAQARDARLDRPGRRPARLRPVAAVVLALIVLLLAAGVAGALGFRLPGFDIVLVDRLPTAATGPAGSVPGGSSPAGTAPAGAGLDLGSPIALAQALALANPRVLVPSTMPRPDVAYVLGGPERPIVTLAWRAEPGGPTIPASDLSLTVMAVGGETDDELIQKLVGPGTTIERVTVDGMPGWWIAGAPHQTVVRMPEGDIEIVQSALSGDTLVFARDGTLYRLESAFGRDATVAIAEGMR